jgi:hypothetical protein
VPLHERATCLAVTLTGPRQNDGGLGRIHLDESTESAPRLACRNHDATKIRGS